MKIKIIVAVVLAGVIISCTTPDKQEVEEAKTVKNVILLIGDGMGLAQIYMGMTASKDNLVISTMPVTGFSKTFSLDNYITDSAAGGTALSSGKKTANGVIGMDTTGNHYKSILEIAEENGLATGMVVTCTITHATPASFIAHQPSRNMYEEIASDFLKTDIDLFIGGGLDNFTKRADSIDLLPQLKEKGYDIITDTTTLYQTTSNKFAALLAAEHLPPILEGRGNMLPKSTKKAIEVLKNDSAGFFLMVEGSQIDWGGHANNQDYIVTEMIDFDHAIAEALDFAKKDGHTLVVVTADHETGGVAITGGDIHTGDLNVAFTTKGHSAIMVPVFAYGPGSEMFSGVYDNTEIFKKMMKAYAFDSSKE